jgi:D-alanyl-D-alanine carboxypeptidase
VWAPEKTLEFVLEPAFDAGTSWAISDTDYVLLGMMIQEATGSTAATEFRRRFLSPLGLNETFLPVEESTTGTIAHGWYDLDADGSLEDLVAAIPLEAYLSMQWTSGAMHASARNLSRWAEALFDGDVLGSNQLAEMLTMNSLNIPGSEYTGYGLGIGSLEVNGTSARGHSGGMPGYATRLLHFPASGMSLAIMVNEESFSCLLDVEEKLARIANEYLASR